MKLRNSTVKYPHLRSNASSAISVQILLTLGSIALTVLDVSRKGILLLVFEVAFFFQGLIIVLNLLGLEEAKITLPTLIKFSRVVKINIATGRTF